MSDKVKNVFISHIHEDDEHLGRMKSLLSKRGYALRDSSINKTKFNKAKDEKYIKNDILAPRIKWAGVMVVLISPDTKKSSYVDWEIQYALKQGKRIVGVYAYGEADCDLPEAFEKYGDVCVGWDGKRIIDAIEGKIDGFENPDGTSRDPRWNVDRFSC